MSGQLVCDGKDDVTVAFGRVENTRSIRKAAVGIIKLGYFTADAIEAPDRNDRFGHLLTVGSDILHGCTADKTGDAAQTFDAGQIMFDANLNERIPIFTGLRGNVG